jgi:surface polysaccharide O-acyltransferase-like enzyme
MKTIEDSLNKRIKSLKWARWFLPLVAILVLVCAIIVFNQGKKVNKIIERSEYGEFFWHGVNVENEYSGWVILAENRYSTAALYLGLAIFLFTGGFVAHMNYRRNEAILDRITELKGEQVGAGQPM